MTIRNGYFNGVMLVLVCLAATAMMLLLLPAEVSCDASGCSRSDNASPTPYGCIPSSGSACYECYYSSGGGTSLCYENGPGNVKFCIDQQW